jgi:hypothetical protein
MEVSPAVPFVLVNMKGILNFVLYEVAEYSCFSQLPMFD